LGMEAQAGDLRTRYAAFLHHALDPGRGRFRNFMGYDRRWLEEVGSDDSHGRALWALGVCVGRSRLRDFQFWAAQTFERALPPVLETPARRGWASALLGIDEYSRRLTGDRRAAQAREGLTARLLELYHQTSADDWPWFEDVLSYDNARLPQALIVA